MNINVNKDEFINDMSKMIANVLCMNSIDMNITFDTKLVNGIGDNDIELSSIDYVEFLVNIENKYNIEFDFNVKIYTIGDVYNYLISYLNREGDHNCVKE